MRDLAWLLLLTAFVGFGTANARPADSPEAAVPVAAGIALAVLACVALALGRWRAEAALLVPGVLVATYFALAFDEGPVYFPLLVGSFLAAWYGTLRRWVVAGAVTAVLLLTGTGVRALTTDIGWWQWLWQGLGVAAMVAAAGLVGSLVRSRRQTRQEQSQRAATQEQLRVAQDLHDGVGHGLAVIAMQAGVGLHVLDRDPDGARSALQAIRESSTESLDILRGHLATLAASPHGSTPETARRSPQPGLAELDALVQRVRHTGLSIRLQRSGPSSGHGRAAPQGPTPLAEPVDAAAFVIVQEALTNVLRHAAAGAVSVDLHHARDALTVTVTDDGTGGHPGARTRPPLAAPASASRGCAVVPRRSGGG